MENNSILAKVDYIMQAVLKKDDSSECLQNLRSLSKEHTDDMVLGRVFGWSISDYAIAALKWINTDLTNTMFADEFDSLPDNRKPEVLVLIAKELYKQY